MWTLSPSLLELEMKKSRVIQWNLGISYYLVYKAYSDINHREDEEEEEEDEEEADEDVDVEEGSMDNTNEVSGEFMEGDSFMQAVLSSIITIN